MLGPGGRGRGIREDANQNAPAGGTDAAPCRTPPKEERVEDYLQVDPVELEIGYGLISLVDESAERGPVRTHHQYAPPTGH